MHANLLNVKSNSIVIFLNGIRKYNVLGCHLYLTMPTQIKKM